MSGVFHEHDHDLLITAGSVDPVTYLILHQRPDRFSPAGLLLRTITVKKTFALLLQSAGSVREKIPVQLSYQIIHHFSEGLYTSPNKALEELVANSYDAFATHVDVVLPDNLSAADATIWVVDDGEAMDIKGFRELWLIGESGKRQPGRESSKRPPIGKFGIGKLATYVLAKHLTYVSKRGGRYFAITMDLNSSSKMHTTFEAGVSYQSSS